MKSLFTTATALLALATPTLAQQVYDLDTITVSADLSDGTETERTGASVDVTTRADLEADGDTQIATYLARQPGLSLAANGGPGGVAYLRIRGLSQKYVAVRIDGIDVSDPSATQLNYDFGRMSTYGVGRVEVLKGAQSAQYGSEAVAGVITIDSRRATEDGTHVTFEGEVGSYGSFSSAATVATKGARGDVSVTIARVETEGFSAADEEDGNTEPDGFSATRLSFAGEYALTDSVTVGASGFIEKARAESDGFAPPTYTFGDTDAVTDSESRALRAFLRAEIGAWSHQVEASAFRLKRTRTENGFGSTFAGERDELRYLAQGEISPALKLNFGADHTVERYTGSSSGEAAVSGVFSEALWSPSASLDLSATLRHDEHDTFGGFTTGRLGAAWRPREDLIFRAAFGTGFRAPSLYELGDPTYGNATLQPEESRSAELGVEKRYGTDTFVKATLFYTEVENLIDYDFATNAYAQVSGTTISKGLELSGQARLSNAMLLFGAYTYTYAENPDGTRQVRVPRHDLVLGLEAELAPRWKARAEVQHVADLLDISQATYTPIAKDNYTLVNATVTYELQPGAEAYFRVENLTDADYEPLDGYGTAGRSIYLGLRATF